MLGGPRVYKSKRVRFIGSKLVAKSARQVAREKLSLRKRNFLKSFFQKEEQESFLFYGGSEHSVFFITRKALSYVMRKQLLKYYLHVGLKKNQTHQGFKPFLLGFHNNLSIVNVTLLTYYLRRGMKFLLSNLLRNYRICLISHQIEQYFNKSRLIFSYHMVFDYWIPGSVSNYTILSKQKVRKEDRFLSRFPQVLLAVRLDPPKFYSINNEAKNAGLPMLSFLDTDLDVSFFNYFFPVNTKHLTSFTYCLFLLTTVIRRSMLVKKLKFVKKNF